MNNQEEKKKRDISELKKRINRRLYNEDIYLIKDVQSLIKLMEEREKKLRKDLCLYCQRDECQTVNSDGKVEDCDYLIKELEEMNGGIKH